MLGSRKGESYSEVMERRRRGFTALWIVFAVFIAYELVAATFFKTAWVETASMEPSIKKGDALAFFPLSSGAFTPFGRLPAISHPARGEIVLVEPPYIEDFPLWFSVADRLLRFATFQRVGLETEPIRGAVPLAIKRVIAVPGDTVYMEDFKCYVKVAGSQHFLTEFETSKLPYDILPGKPPALWQDDMPGSGSMRQITLGEDEFLVLGDNRGSTMDSRHFGLVKEADFRGVLLFRYWPFTAFGAVR